MEQKKTERKQPKSKKERKLRAPFTYLRFQVGHFVLQVAHPVRVVQIRAQLAFGKHFRVLWQPEREKALTFFECITIAIRIRIVCTLVSNRETSCFSSATTWLCSVNLIFTFISSSFMRDSKSEYLQWFQCVGRVVEFSNFQNDLNWIKCAVVTIYSKYLTEKHVFTAGLPF